MSIAVLTQVYDEMRRLAIAGSVVSVGDFRLKKLLPSLEQAGAKSPVFAKVAEAVKGVVNGTEQTSSTALLELATLVNAILYTQGDSSAPGTLTDIESIDMAGSTSQTSARVLKPLLEALTTTGSGRIETIKDAHERGAFRDLRLIKPAIAAIDDPYPEIADFVAEKILPIYGKAIVAELRAKLDLKGTTGHPRRLRLLHVIDPAGTRSLLTKALEEGSKEVKVVAIESLGSEKEDLTYLIEQTKAKAQEVRQAAYRALAGIDNDAAVEVVHKAMTGKDLAIAAQSLVRNRNAKLLGYILAGADREIADLADMTDKKEIGRKIERIQMLLNCLHGRDDKDTSAFLMKLFGMRDALAEIKGTDFSGVDLNQHLVMLMHHGSITVKKALAEAHASLTAGELAMAFHAAREVLPADVVYVVFSPYLADGGGSKRKGKGKSKDDALARREAIIRTITQGGAYYYGWRHGGDATKYDPRWLDLAVEAKDLDMIQALARPGHAGAVAFLSDAFEEKSKGSKNLNEFVQVLSAMVHSSHPDATDAFLVLLEKYAKKKAGYYGFWFGHLLPGLPKSAIPRIEAVLPELPDNIADQVIGYLQQLRDKK